MSATNSTTTHTAGVSLTSLPLYQVAVSLWTFYYPVLLLLGTFGNVMSIVIMRRLMTKESTINLFFMALAAGDMLVLYSGIVMKWINVVYSLNIVDSWPALYYSSLTCYLSSVGYVSWILVCMTLQRALSVAWPHRVSRVFTRGRVIKVIVGIAVFQLALFSHHLYCIYATSTTDMTGFQCMRMSSLRYVWFLGNVFVYIAMVLDSLLPFVCLVIGNGVLVITLIVSVRELGRTMASGNPHLSLKRQQDTNSVTSTIIVVSVTFIALTLPVFIYAEMYQFTDHSGLSTEKKAEVFLFYSVSSLLVSTNSAVNFYLYCLTGRRFREELVKTLSCGRRKM